MALLTAQLKKNTKRTIRQLGDVIRIVRPETVIRWHRELVRRKWAQPSKKKAGRPKINHSTESLIVCLRYSKSAEVERRTAIENVRPNPSIIMVSIIIMEVGDADSERMGTNQTGILH